MQKWKVIHFNWGQNTRQREGDKAHISVILYSEKKNSSYCYSLLKVKQYSCYQGLAYQTHRNKLSLNIFYSRT